MRCTSPRTVGWQADGTTICWSKKQYSKEFATFQLPCGKCIDCRLEYARQWAVRCVHEAQMHSENIFLTLTYDEKHLESDKLIYRDFQLFMKRLRRENEAKATCIQSKKQYITNPIGMFVTGEYGEKNKRPHWHAIIFNYKPHDYEYKYTTDRGDKTYSSPSLSKLWGKGTAEFGSVTFESAGYCARYASKKLVHGCDDEHDFKPISKKSSKHAIGKKWLEQNWKDIFSYGDLIVDGRTAGAIPRYYLKWFKENHPTEWKRYVTEVALRKQEAAALRAAKIQENWVQANIKRLNEGKWTFIPTQNQQRKLISLHKQKQLESYLKL